MPLLLTPKLLLRGFEIFVLASLVGWGITLLYGNDLPAFLAGLRRVEWIWVLAGLVLASLDWIGGGLRLWVVARHIYPKPPLKGLILAGGMGAWAGYITPVNTGAGPMTMYTMRRYGVPLPVAVTSTFMSFVATVLFFAIAGPLAVFFGAGRSLGQRGNVLGLSLFDLFLGSLVIIAGIGVLMAVVIFFPRAVRDLLHRLAEGIGRRHAGVAARLEKLQAGIDHAHESVVAFNSPRGWLALFWATVLSVPPTPTSFWPGTSPCAPSGCTRISSTFSWFKRWSCSCCTSRRHRVPPVSARCCPPPSCLRMCHAS